MSFNPELATDCSANRTTALSVPD